jgi:hypothetical protein
MSKQDEHSIKQPSILREEHQAIGFLVDIDETFRDKPVKPAVGLPEWPVYIFIPMAALLTPVAITTIFRTGDVFVQSLPPISFKTLITLLFWAVAALICGIATLRFFLLIVNELKALCFLSQHGQVTTALIVELCRHGGTGAFSNPTEYTMLYRFQASHASGVTAIITGREKISKHIYETYRTQKTVNVRYVPTKSEWFRLDL